MNHPNPYSQNMDRNNANFVALSPLSFIERTARIYPQRTAIIYGQRRQSWGETHVRCLRLASALAQRGVGPGSTVAAMLPNVPAMLEAHFGVPMTGAVLNTLNTRLDAEAIAFMLRHGEAKVLLTDREFSKVVGAALALLGTDAPLVIEVEDDDAPDGTRLGAITYEALLSEGDPGFRWVRPSDEWDAIALNYTSGTTGNPKAALYSHRSTILHAYAAALPDVMCMSARDAILPVVPMFHVNAWGLPYAACMTGAKLVFPGAGLDGKSLYELFESEGVTMAAGVPTVWQGLLNHVQSNQLAFRTMRRTVIGGSACPPAMVRTFEEDYKVHVIHAWGMTELSPLGTVCAFKAKHMDQSAEARQAVQAKQGRAVFGVDMKIVSPEGAELPHDGEHAGDLLVRGHWVVSRYFKEAGEGHLVDGWFPTGDVAKIDADGYMQITDRSKDVIKSGGEWIGSIDLENIAMAHPAVAMAACIAAKHPKWDERPLLVVMRKPGQEVSREELLAFYDGKIAKWWTPDDVVFVESIPLGATGKMLKHRLREQFKDYALRSV